MYLFIFLNEWQFKSVKSSSAYFSEIYQEKQNFLLKHSTFS